MEPRERRVALVRQPTTLFPHLSVGANVTYRVGGRGLVGGVSVERLLEEVGLGGLAGAAPDSLSGGAASTRACLARAIARPFRALLLDEPFSAVDAASRALLRSIASDASERGGAAAILVTHDLGEAQAFGHRLGIIDKGGLLQVASTEVLVRQPATNGWPSSAATRASSLTTRAALGLHPDRFVEGAWPDRGIVFGGTVRSVQAFGPRYACEIVLLAGEDSMVAGQSAVQVHAESPPRVGDRWEVTALDPPLVSASSIDDKEGGSNVEDPQPHRGPVETCAVGTGVLPD